MTLRGLAAVVIGLSLAAGCTQDFDAFRLGGAGGSAATDASLDSEAGHGGRDASVEDAVGKDANDAADASADRVVEGGCPPGSKLCDGACVLDTNPSFGCAGATCAPCTFRNATATCSTTGACAIAQCRPGYSDCNHNPVDGCEANLATDPNNCHACGTTCVEPNATAKCDQGTCAVASCDPGYQDCDPNQAGCETHTSADPTACGSCTNDCTKNPGNWICNNGVCQVSTCPKGLGDCDSNPQDCETNLNTSVDNCGFCNNPCNLHHATAACDNGTCVIAKCDPGFADCDGRPGDGCEVNLNTDSANCGQCKRACSNQNASSVSCTGGLCTPTCNVGYGDCTEPAAPAPDNGCEANLKSSTTDCGACGRGCSSAHTTGLQCNQGRCTPTCTSGYANCSEPLAPALDDGCETNSASDPLNCGACRHACSLDNATGVACTQGACTPTCQSGYDDCTTPAAPSLDDGCETAVNFDPNNCGACGRTCSSSHVASLDCSFGICDSLCNSGYGNCNQPASPQPDDGCETYITTDPSHCGSCDRACVAFHTNQLSCSGGVCTSTCQAGWGNCSEPAAPAADDGCETSLSTNANCGGCGRACSLAHAATTTCSGGKCAASCVVGYGDCIEPVAPTPDDGCESNLNTNPLNCGACGRACSSAHVASLSCSQGACDSTCSPGYVNCNQPTSGADDGCETAQSNTHCGSCANSCTAQRNGFVCGQAPIPTGVCGCTSDSQCVGAVAKCSSGHCTGFGTTCRFGETFYTGACHCNGGSACSSSQVCCQQGGCKNLSNDPVNCGECGRICPPNFVCGSGQCVCQGNTSCNAGSPGTCNGSACVCAGTTCPGGQRCLANGQCG